MSFLSSRFFLPLEALLCLWLPLEAAETFRLFSQPLLIPERGEVTSYFLLAGSNRFSFLPPAQWQISAKTEKREVTILSRDQSAGMSIKIVVDGIAAKGKPDLDKWRKEALKRYPNAKIVSESSCYSGDGEGICFEFHHIAAQKAKMSTRLAIVPFWEGIVEFLFTAPRESSEDYAFTFANLLTSFHSEKCASPE